MKKLFSAHVVSFLLGLCAVVISCSKDDTTDLSQPTETGIVGTWCSDDEQTVFVFRKDGSGLCCEHATTSEASLDEFSYTFDKSAKRLSMTFSDGTVDLPKAEVASTGSSLVFSNDSREFLDGVNHVTLTRASEPVPALFITNSDFTLKESDSGSVLLCNAAGGTKTITLHKELLWHESSSATYDLSLYVTSDPENMITSRVISRDEGNEAIVATVIAANTTSSSRTAVLGIKANEKLWSYTIEQSAAQTSGNSMEVVSGSSTISAQGGTLQFYVYNKDKANITVYHPQNQTVTWSMLSTVRYAGGQDWLCRVVVPANTSSTDTNHSYKFVKDDGTVIYHTVRQLAGTSGSSGDTGGSTDPVWGKVTLFVSWLALAEAPATLADQRIPCGARSM